MENQFRVINRNTRKEKIFNSEEITRFFHAKYDERKKKIIYNNNQKDYAISVIKSNKSKFAKDLLISVIGILFVILTSKIIMQWMNI